MVSMSEWSLCWDLDPVILHFVIELKRALGGISHEVMLNYKLLRPGMVEMAINTSVDMTKSHRCRDVMCPFPVNVSSRDG